jgi:hypothetical protein
LEIKDMKTRILLGICSVLFLSSCLKDNSVEQEVASATALNAVPGIHGLIIGLDQNQLNFPSRGETFAYKDILPYKAVYAKNRLVRVFDPIESLSTTPIAEANVTFAKDQFYTLYLVGKEDSLEIIYTQDDLKRPEAGKAKIRFIHLSPDAPALDLVIQQSTDSLLANNKAFKSFTSFQQIEGGKEYTFRLKVHDTEEVLKTFTFKPQPHRIYTIWARGLVAEGTSANKSFEEGIITH